MAKKPHSSSISKPYFSDKQNYKNKNECFTYRRETSVSSGTMFSERNVTWKSSISSKGSKKLASFEYNIKKTQSENRNLRLNRKNEHRKKVFAESINDV